MLTIRQLKILDAIVETGTVTAAAKRIHVTQSAVSKTLSAVETYVEFQIFERRRKHLVLTERGLSLYKEARRLLGMVDDFGDIIVDIRDRGAQRIRVATTQVIASSGFVTAALSEFCFERPNLQLEIDTMQRQDLVRAAAGDRADVVIGNLPFTSSEIVTSKFGENHILAIAKKGTFLENIQTVTAQNLSQMPVIFLFERSRLRRIIDHYMYRAGKSLQIRAQVASSHTIIQFAKNGGGVGICDGLSLADSDLSELDICAFNEPLSMDIGFLRRQNDTDNAYQKRIEELIVANWKKQNAPFFIT